MLPSLCCSCIQRASNEAEAEGEEESASVAEPPLELFDAALTLYTSMSAEIAELPGQAVLGWMRVDAKPVRVKLGLRVNPRFICRCRAPFTLGLRLTM